MPARASVRRLTVSTCATPAQSAEAFVRAATASAQARTTGIRTRIEIRLKIGLPPSGAFTISRGHVRSQPNHWGEGHKPVGRTPQTHQVGQDDQTGGSGPA